ncbi:hypothetical protein EP073_10735 [Geovibrio thiophilus]|uniref:Iron transporter n=1 Tax=Geovibrio thiophilus TaxID=139438 RepID=A0A3R5UVQ4_9BACT|nr:hypothetical protein [Geovibrio thiophilus]QAR33858.1 hypothetical protein EP073_10735 [Geovibrio thiophilus]
MAESIPEKSHGFETVSRILLGVAGGYALSAMVSALLAGVMPFNPIQSEKAANMLFFITYACALVWVFSNAGTKTVWAVMLVLFAVTGSMLLLGGA